MSGQQDTPRDQEKVRQWVELVTLPKCIFGWPDWVTVSSGKTAGAASADQYTLTVLLADGAGAAIEDLQLKIVVWRDRPNDDATALLLALDAGQWLSISRLDCWPPAPHINPHWREVGGPAEVFGSHVHLASDNARLGRKAFNPFGNLPHAIALEEEPYSFHDMMLQVERHFNIDGAKKLPAPDWQGRLL